MKLNDIFSIHYTQPNFAEEYEEALRYPMFQHMTHSQWIDVAKRGFKLGTTPQFIEQLNNTDAGEPSNFNQLERPKIKRFQQALASKTIEMPMVLHTTDGYELLGGNTRLTGLVARGVYPPVWVVDVRDLEHTTGFEPA